MPTLKTLEQPQPLARLAYETLKDSIVSGKLKPGEIYNEKSLARELNISRTPVREALLELSARGLVTFLPRKGVMVNYYTRRDVEEIFEVRKAIELFSLSKALGDGGLDTAGLEQSLHDQQAALEAGDMLAFMEADRRFHLGLGDLAGNRRLVAILDNLRDMVQVMGLEALAGAGRPHQVLEEHRRVCQALAAGRRDEALHALEEHLDRSREAVLEAREGIEP